MQFFKTSKNELTLGDEEESRASQIRILSDKIDDSVLISEHDHVLITYNKNQRLLKIIKQVRLQWKI